MGLGFVLLWDDDEDDAFGVWALEGADELDTCRCGTDVNTVFAVQSLPGIHHAFKFQDVSWYPFEDRSDLIFCVVICASGLDDVSMMK